MADGNTRGTDLFGNPIPATREKAGRPEHVWTLENSNKINLMFAMGFEPKDTAAAIGISTPTLRKHYFSELEQWRVARLKLTATQLQLLSVQAAAGKVAAIKELFKRMEKAELARLSDRVSDRGGQAKVKPPKLGKKEAASVAAGEVRGKFAPPPPPLLH